MEQGSFTSAPPTASSRLDWIDRIKGFALIWIFLNHAVEWTLGEAHFSNPVPGWPPFNERLHQLAPLRGSGLGGILLNLFRYAGWTGEQGVQLFLILSGFGLTWGLLEKRAGPSLPLKEFYMRRLLRLYPLWWAVHSLVILAWLAGETYIGRSFILSVIGLRFTPSTFYGYSPSWWFFGLLVQLCLIFPLLWKGLSRLGPWRLLILTGAACLAARACGILWLTRSMDPWLRGAIFLTRLPEFVLGMVLAHFFHHAPRETDAWLRSRRQILASAGLYVLGTWFALTWAGMTAAPFLLGAGAFGMLFPLLSGIGSPSGGVLGWIGRHSFSLYLVHHPILWLLVPPSPPAVTLGVSARILAAAVMACGTGVILERGVGFVERGVQEWQARGRMKPLAWRFAALVSIGGALLLGLELIVRQYAPGEVLGWGERPSLTPDDRFGWRLRPSRTTRLRWESYDYVVTANALGFPGPDVPEAKPPDTVRLLVTGDAFTSAEGVDTGDAWPRRLESRLSALRGGQNVQVLNFAITGYGPNQYSRVVQEFAPKYHPDLIIVELYVNDFEDVLTPDEMFRESIHFSGPDPNGVRSVAGLEHLRSWMRLHLIEPAWAKLTAKPDPNAIFLRGVSYLERGRTEWWTRGRDLMARRLAEIKVTADRVGAQLLIFMVPAAVQVFGPSELDLYPTPLDLSDSVRFDIELPQRLAREIAERENILFIDLREPLRRAPHCPYQPRNMHWTVLGHEAVAQYLARMLSDDSRLLPPPRPR